MSFFDLLVISGHSVMDAPTNPKFLDFSEFGPYFHVVKSFFLYLLKKKTVKNFIQPKKEQFFWWKWSKTLFSHKYWHLLFQFNVISMLWETYWGALHVCRSKIVDVENSFQIPHIFESSQPWGCYWRGYATHEANQELNWKLRTLSVWEI